MFADAKYLEQWFFPPNVIVLKSVLDFEVGRSYLYGMAMPDRPPIWGRLDFEKIDEPRSIIYVQSITDENGRVIAPLAGSAWLLRMKSEIGIGSHKDGVDINQKISIVEANNDEQGFVRFSWQKLCLEYELSLDRLALIFEQARN